MTDHALDIVILGLSITSSWGNGHATTYRGLVRELCARGHRVVFLERDVPWYAQSRDLARPPYGHTCLYGDLEELRDRFGPTVAHADVVVLGSYVPDGIAIADWIVRTARGTIVFYDIDTPVTLANLERGTCPYLAREQIRNFDLYLSFSGGPVLTRLERVYGAPLARALYCSFDPELYFPEGQERSYDLGYMGTYSPDRQPVLDRLMLEPARRWKQGRFVVAGPQYPEEIDWPGNLERIEHLPPAAHRRFYNSQRLTLNVTRNDMVRLGWSPSVRLFEAAACGACILSDYWKGLDEFFTFGREILISESPAQTLYFLREVPQEVLSRIGERARHRVTTQHTAAHRAEEFEHFVHEARLRAILKQVKTA